LVNCSDDCKTPAGEAVPNGLFGGVTDGRISVTNNVGESEFEQQENFYLANANAVPERLLVPPSVLMDRALVVRARSTSNGADAASVDTKTEQRASAPVSTSPQTMVQRLLALDPQALKAAAASGQYPGLVDLLTSQNNLVSYVQGRSTNVNGSTVAETESDSLTVREIRAKVDAVNGKFFFDAESLAVQLNKTMPIGAIKGTGVYLGYEAPQPSPGGQPGNPVGSHLAFGDTPRVAMPTAGTAQFNFAGSTTPTDSFGRSGTLAAGRLGMDFQSRHVKTIDPIDIRFAAAGPVAATSYSIASGNVWSMAPGAQNLADLRCTGCNASPVGTINGRIVGITAVGYAAAITVQSTVGSPGTNHVAASALAFGRN
ncbi:MAG: hypothetical protein RLZZ401_715, partial [Pseudomonadota bacterium]